jgi:hypothetical protein
MWELRKDLIEGTLEMLLLCDSFRKIGEKELKGEWLECDRGWEVEEKELKGEWLECDSGWATVEALLSYLNSKKRSRRNQIKCSGSSHNTILRDLFRQTEVNHKNISRRSW